jgi:hypothetical protein
MPNNFPIEFFRDLYKSDFDRRDKHDSADSFLLAITTLLGTVGIYTQKFLSSEVVWMVLPSAVAAIVGGFVFCRSKRFAKRDYLLLAIASIAPSAATIYLAVGIHSLSDFISLCFTTLFGAFVGFFVLSVISILGSVWPRDVAYISESAKLHEWLVNLAAFYEIPNDDKKRILEMEEEELTKELRVQYVECSQKNRESNLVKQKWQSTGRTAMALAVATILLNGLPIYYRQLHHKERLKVEIVNFPQTGQVSRDRPNGK